MSDDREIGLTPSVRKIPTDDEKAASEAKNNARPHGPPDAEWKLYYWPALMGRGEFVRVMLVECDQDWNECGLSEGVGAVASYLQKNPNGGPPTYAPPVLVNAKTGFTLSQTPIILQYLGRKYGLAPADEEAFAVACAVNATIHDFVQNGRLAFHQGPDQTKSYYPQARSKETREAIEFCKTTAMPKYMKYLEAFLSNNKAGQGFLVGDGMSFADVSLFVLIDAVEYQLPEAFASWDLPLLKAFQKRMAARPKIAAYLSSPRRGAFEGNSFM